MPNSNSNSMVRRLDVVELESRPPKLKPQEPPEAVPQPPVDLTPLMDQIAVLTSLVGRQQAVSSKADTMDVMLAAFQALAFAISARALLMLSIVGAFVLAVLAMEMPDGMRLGILIAYAVLVVVPMCFLEFRRREA